MEKYQKNRLESRVGRHTRNNNGGTIGIVLVGNFNEDKPTEAQYKALNQKISEIQTRRNIKSIRGHGELKGEATACPGKLFDKMRVEQIKKRTTPQTAPKPISKPQTKPQQDIKKKYSAVVIEGKPQSASDNASYARNKCMGQLNDPDGYYGCKNFVLTLNSENRERHPQVKGKLNDNGSQDFGICQLNNTYHIDFITSTMFNNPKKQIDYCLGVWIDAKKKGSMPRSGFYKKTERGVNVIFKE